MQLQVARPGRPRRNLPATCLQVGLSPHGRAYDRAYPKPFVLIQQVTCINTRCTVPDATTSATGAAVGIMLRLAG